MSTNRTTAPMAAPNPTGRTAHPCLCRASPCLQGIAKLCHRSHGSRVEDV